MTKIAFFDTKPYDRESFDSLNTDGKYPIKYFTDKLTADTAIMSKGYDCVCAFVNDTLDKSVLDILQKNGIKLVALRSAGYNNVDLSAAFGKMHVVRVPAYSPYAVAEP